MFKSHIERSILLCLFFNPAVSTIGLTQLVEETGLFSKCTEFMSVTFVTMNRRIRNDRR